MSSRKSFRYRIYVMVRSVLCEFDGGREREVVLTILRAA
jgi:hypothetical protein